MIIHIGNGCEGCSSNLFIPAKSKLTSEDETLTRHVFFLEFNDEYQDLTKYSVCSLCVSPHEDDMIFYALTNKWIYTG